MSWRETRSPGAGGGGGEVWEERASVWGFSAPFILTRSAAHGRQRAGLEPAGASGTGPPDSCPHGSVR